MRQIPRVAAWAACGLVFLLAWLALQPRAAPVPTGPFIPGFSAAHAQAHVRAHVRATSRDSMSHAQSTVATARSIVVRNTDADAVQAMGAWLAHARRTAIAVAGVVPALVLLLPCALACLLAGLCGRCLPGPASRSGWRMRP
jgi:hypothetical protein